jgi:hypothetical protein
LSSNFSQRSGLSQLEEAGDHGGLGACKCLRVR